MTHSTKTIRRWNRPLQRWTGNWMRFWFEPADPMTLGLIRVLTGLMLTYNLLIWGVDLEAFFAADGLQPVSAIQRLHDGTLVFSFWHYVPDAWIRPMHYACVVVAALFCVGACSRITSIAAFAITISYSQRVPVANFGLDQILGMLCLYLAIGPSGAAMSMDAWWRKRKIRRRAIRSDAEDDASGQQDAASPEVSTKSASACLSGVRESATREFVAAETTETAVEADPVSRLPAARMTLRLMQIHMCIIYFWAGFAKLKGDSWWTGEAMWRVIANQEYQTIDLTWMAQVPWLPYLIAHVTVAWEVFFCVLVWNRSLRPLILFVGTLMHVGIGAFLGMWTFGLVMTFPYLAFSDATAWRRRINVISGRTVSQ